MIDRIERAITLEGDLELATRAKLLEIADECPVHRTLFVLECGAKGFRSDGEIVLRDIRCHHVADSGQAGCLERADKASEGVVCLRTILPSAEN